MSEAKHNDHEDIDRDDEVTIALESYERKCVGDEETDDGGIASLETDDSKVRSLSTLGDASEYKVAEKNADGHYKEECDSP